MDNESHTSGDAVRNDVPITERIAGDMREQVQTQSSRAADGAQHAADRRAVRRRGWLAW